MFYTCTFYLYAGCFSIQYSTVKFLCITIINKQMEQGGNMNKAHSDSDDNNVNNNHHQKK